MSIQLYSTAAAGPAVTPARPGSAAQKGADLQSEFRADGRRVAAAFGRDVGGAASPCQTGDEKSCRATLSQHDEVDEFMIMKK